MMLKMERTRLSFFLLWFPIVSVCIYLGTLLSYPLGEYFYHHNGMPYSPGNDGYFEGAASILFLVGLFMGFGQWIVINTKIKKVHNWVLATLIGFVFGSVISVFFFAFTMPITGKYYKVYEWISMTGSLAGSGWITGFCQWLSLGRKISTSLRWSAVMAFSFAIGMVLNSLLDTSFRVTSFLIFSIVVGLISGIFAESSLVQPELQLQKDAAK
jgi:hypothetical protein